MVDEDKEGRVNRKMKRTGVKKWKNCMRVFVHVCAYPKVSMPKGACAYFHHPLMPPASTDITAGPERV